MKQLNAKFKINSRLIAPYKTNHYIANGPSKFTHHKKTKAAR